jgi:hypothetical protein
MKTTTPDRCEGVDISLYIVLTSLIDGAALVFNPWGVNPGTCWMVVWFDLTQFGSALAVNGPSCCSHPAHSQIRTLSYSKNCKYTDLANINS